MLYSTGCLHMDSITHNPPVLPELHSCTHLLASWWDSKANSVSAEQSTLTLFVLLGLEKNFLNLLLVQWRGNMNLCASHPLIKVLLFYTGDDTWQWDLVTTGSTDKSEKYNGSFVWCFSCGLEQEAWNYVAFKEQGYTDLLLRRNFI